MLQSGEGVLPGVSVSAIKGSRWKHRVMVALVRSSFRLLLVLMVKLLPGVAKSVPAPFPSECSCTGLLVRIMPEGVEAVLPSNPVVCLITVTHVYCMHAHAASYHRCQRTTSEHWFSFPPAHHHGSLCWRQGPMDLEIAKNPRMTLSF